MAYIGRPPEYGGYEKQDLTADGSTTTFTLNFTVGTESSILVSVAGVFQQPGSAYTLSGGGTNIVFSTAPASSETVFVIFLGFSLDAGNAVNTGSITSQTALGTTPAAADSLLIYDDSTSLLKKVTYANFGGDISSVVAGTGLSGGGTSGAVTLNVEAAQTQITSLGTIASLVATTADINAGTFDGIVGGTTPAAGTFTTGTITTADINGGAIDGTIIGASSAAAGTFTTFTSTGIDDNADALAMTITSAEMVGIGATSPGGPSSKYKLDFGPTSATPCNILAIANEAGNGASNDAMRGIGVADYSSSYSMAFWAHLGSAEASTSNWRMKIDASGGHLLLNHSLGIGTTAPTELLSITGTTPRIRLDSATTSDDPGITLTRQGSATLRGTIYYASSAGNLYIENGYDSAGANILFRTRVGGTPVDVLTLKGDGEVKVTGQAYFADTTLTFDATQDWDLLTNQVCTLTLTANTTFDAPTNMIDGAFYNILMIQDGTGSRTASWNTVFKWAGGTAPTLTTTASAKDIFVFRSDGTNMYEVGRQLNVS